MPEGLKFKFKKKLFICAGIIVAGVALVILFISPITKYLIEKYDEKYTGRQITMDWAYVNPFTGYIHFSNLKIYEYQSDSLALSMKGLSANFDVMQLFYGTMGISDLTLDQPLAKVIQKKRQFNFNDLIEKFSSKEPRDTTRKPLHVYFRNIKIREGHFFYIDQVIPVNFSIKKVDIDSKDGWDSEKDLISADVSFLSEKGSGGMKGTYSMNLKSLDYIMNVVVNTFDMDVLEQYLRGFANYGTFTATFDADLKTNGCFRDAESINIKGQLAVNDFHFGKNPAEDYLSFDKVVCNLKDVNPKERRYFIDSVSLFHPYFKYEQYDYLNNVQTMFGKEGEKVSAAHSDAVQFNLIFTIGEYIRTLAGNFLHSDYKVNKVGIYNGDLHFNDYSLSEKFSMDLNPLFISADSVYKDHKRVNVSFMSGIKPYGNIAATLSISPKDDGDFDMQYRLEKLPTAMFNPYTISFTSFPFDRGTIGFNGTWAVRDGRIQSSNHILLVDPRITRRLKNKDTKWIPLPLIMSFVRERGNVIDYEIPITGNLKNPNFHLHDVIFDLLKNIFIKPPTTLYRLQVKNTETEIEKSLTLKWQMRQNSLRPGQQRFVKGMADFLVKNPEARMVVSPQEYSLKEKEYILFFEAKKKYFLVTHNKTIQSFNDTDSAEVDKMSVKDSLFVHYLNKKVNDTMIFTIQDKCARFVDSAIINSRFRQLNRERENAFILYFKKRDVEKQLKMSSPANVVPYNGFSFYKIEYKGEFPESLVTAYQQMNEFNDEAPRKKFKKERRENRNNSR